MNKKRDRPLIMGEKGWISLTAAVILVALVTAGVAIVPASAVPVVVRNIDSDYVGPCDVITVTIEFTTTEDNFLLGMQDQVPLGWNVTDRSVNEEAFLTDFNATTGIVMFAWLGMGDRIDITAEYKLHVPLDAEFGEYIIVGNLQGITQETHDEWTALIPNGTVVVERPYGVHLTVDEEEKTTVINVNATYYLTVENIGTTGDSYELSITSTEADFARLNKSSVSLGAGESEVVELKVASSSSGRYNTTVSAASAHASDEITVTTVVRAVRGVDLKVEGGDYANKTVEPNETASYTLTVKNTGSDSDSYELEVSNKSNADTAVLDRYMVPNLAAGASANVVLNVSDAEEGEYVVNVTATSQGNVSVNDRVMTKTVIDTTPPASITNLQYTNGSTWISWTWTNPGDADFSHVMVYLNGTWQENTSAVFYNATGLNPDTEYEIGTRTVDNAGNINATWVNGTASTLSLPDTEPPASITDLQYTNGTTWIHWTWTNPGDADFSHVMVYLNGTWQENTSAEYFNATGLIYGTRYTIGTHTVDINGNINQTWVNDTVIIGEPTAVFDTGFGTYPSISGTHNGTIKPKETIEVSTLYTYPCPGTGGHTEYARIWNNTGLNATATWKGYVGDWHNISFYPSFTLIANETYNYTIITGSYPQIHHESTRPTANGGINCTDFTDANGRVYYDWIPAIRLYF